jgi:hypothetical protein
VLGEEHHDRTSSALRAKRRYPGSRNVEARRARGETEHVPAFCERSCDDVGDHRLVHGRFGIAAYYASIASELANVVIG